MPKFYASFLIALIVLTTHCPVVASEVSYGFPEYYTQFIEELVASNPYQLSVKEYSLIAAKLFEKQPCNMLVFGVGNDSRLWMELNKEGTTLFLEDNEYWLQQVKEKLPGIKAYRVKYATLRSQWQELLHSADPNALHMNLPPVVFDTKWDIIFVDAPEGYADTKPGRMKSIYIASLLSHQGHNAADVFVHDCDRIVEAVYASTFLHDENLQTSVDRLRHYTIP